MLKKSIIKIKTNTDIISSESQFKISDLQIGNRKTLI